MKNQPYLIQMEPEVPSTTEVIAKVKTNHGFKPLERRPSRNLLKLEAFPERIGYLRESLKEYLLLKKNVYLNRRKKEPTEDDVYRCDCISSLHATKEDWENKDVSIDCGEGCLNRQMSSECEGGSCPCGITCQNRRFQMHQNCSVYPKPTEGKGFGLIAGEHIKKGSFVLQYIGEIISLNSEEGQRRIQEYSSSTCTYMMKLNSNEVIDPTYKGNMARFINHSCDPNCETQKWNVLGEIAVGIFSTREILEGEELSFNYQFDVYQTPFTRCLCGSTSCKGYLGLVPLGYTAEEWNQRVETMPCEICGSNDEDDDDKFIICDNCNNGYHMFCLDPKMNKIPEGAWFCKKCLEKEASKQEVKALVDDEINLKRIIKRTKSSNKTKMPKQSRRRKGEARKIVVEDLAENDEVYNLQKQLQAEIIAKFGTKEDLKHAEQEDEEDEEQEEEGTEEEEIVEESSKNNKNEKKSRFEFIKDQIKTQFLQLLKETELIKKMGDQAFIDYVNKDQNLSRRNISVSTIELLIFQESVFRSTKRLGVKLFWDRNFNRRDYFSKTSEFRLFCNDNHYEWFRAIFELMDHASINYKQINNFTNASINVPAIFLKRIIGEYKKNVHHIQSEFQVTMQYESQFFNDDCYPLDVNCRISFKGIRENIERSVEYLQGIVDELKVHRLYMGSSDIKIIIQNLMPIKQQIHPSEIRCCRDNALRDINHPFYTIYYSDKEVAFVGTEDEIRKSINIVQGEIDREKQIKKNIISVNYLIPVCEKNELQKIKSRIENLYDNTKLIIYNPTNPRKNISLTLSTTYNDFKNAYEDMRDQIDDLGVFEHKFEDIQIQTIFQMTKYFFKYMQNYFQTKSAIFMKAWDTMTTDYLIPCQDYKSTLVDIKKYFIRDHEFKFYILSVTRLAKQGAYSNILLTKNNVITLCKSIVNRTVHDNKSLQSKNYQSVFSFDSNDFTNFLEYFRPSSYFVEYSKEQTSDIEAQLYKKLSPELIGEPSKGDSSLRKRKRSEGVDPFNFEDGFTNQKKIRNFQEGSDDQRTFGHSQQSRYASNFRGRGSRDRSQSSGERYRRMTERKPQRKIYKNGNSSQESRHKKERESRDRDPRRDKNKTSMKSKARYVPQTHRLERNEGERYEKKRRRRQDSQSSSASRASSKSSSSSRNRRRKNHEKYRPYKEYKHSHYGRKRQSRRSDSSGRRNSSNREVLFDAGGHADRSASPKQRKRDPRGYHSKKQAKA